MAESLEQLLSRLKLHWTEQGLQASQPATDAEVLTFETIHRVVLESEVSTYFRAVNGIVGGRNGRIDAEHVAFWNLAQVKTVAEETGERAGDDLLVFADWSLWAHAYAFRPGVPGSKSRVFLVGGQAPEQVASGFGEFLRGYVAGDHDVLFGTGSRPSQARLKESG